jgi:Rps23 Pro-64 3,4-dihydroxylase Tpa1-like proline 4-hydroxylase
MRVMTEGSLRRVDASLDDRPMKASLSKQPAELAILARERRGEYLAGSPWPHLVLDDLIDPAVIAAAEAQEIGRGLELQPHRSYRHVKAESPEVVGAATKALQDDLDSPPFLEFLEQLTGVPNLVADPSHFWAGVHVSSAGAFQAVHRDFRKHPVSKLFHRVNVLTYLNSDWESAFGGELELWSSDMTGHVERIAPLAGKMVIFETTPETLHGVPDPVRCPPGRARLSLASYYYSESPGPQHRLPALLRRPRRPQDPWFTGFAAPSDGVAGLGRLVKRLLD